jgi:hypothetical protein
VPTKTWELFEVLHGSFLASGPIRTKTFTNIDESGTASYDLIKLVSMSSHIRGTPTDVTIQVNLHATPGDTTSELINTSDLIITLPPKWKLDSIKDPDTSSMPFEHTYLPGVLGNLLILHIDKDHALKHDQTFILALNIPYDNCQLCATCVDAYITEPGGKTLRRNSSKMDLHVSEIYEKLEIEMPLGR